MMYALEKIDQEGVERILLFYKIRYKIEKNLMICIGFGIRAFL